MKSTVLARVPLAPYELLFTLQETADPSMQQHGIVAGTTRNFTPAYVKCSVHALVQCLAMLAAAFLDTYNET
jgi:hypothetical protein